MGTPQLQRRPGTYAANARLYALQLIFYLYRTRGLLICPECAHEWTAAPAADAGDDKAPAVKDANGNPLRDGDTVTVIKDLKVKGASLVIKAGTKVKNIRLVSGDHDIDCKIDGIGAMKLKSEFVKKT